MQEIIVFSGKGSAEVHLQNLPEIESKQLLLQNQFSMISPGTELALFNGTHIGFSDPSITWAKYPVYPGYASVGTVEEFWLNSKIDGGNLNKGDRVLYYPPHARYGVLDPDSMIWSRIPQSVEDQQALFARFAQISYSSIDAASASPERVLVLGAGIVGNLAAQLFSRVGAQQVIISDISARRIDIAYECGIEYVLPADKEKPEELLHDLTEGKGVDIVVEATGVPELVRTALRYIEPGGEVILLGSPRGSIDLDLYSLVHRKFARLIGAHEIRLPAKTREKSEKPESREAVLKKMLEEIGNGNLQVEPMISHRIYPREVQNAYEQLSSNREEYMGVIIDWSEEEPRALRRGR